ncbi:hypothetical protein C8J56DRAFT_893787 [Mycena floridula]|nr:hypothetical protein C8J56DRAFT_893787 [Mycena floridula]
MAEGTTRRATRATPGISQASKTAVKVSNDEEDEEEVEEEEGGKKHLRKKRDPGLKWDKNPDWTSRAVDYLVQHPAFRCRLFSDSTSEANAEGRKSIMFANLAQAIFDNIPDQATQAAYKADSQKYARSTQQHFSRLKKQYMGAVKQLYQTGGGLKPDDIIENLHAKFRDEFGDFWDDLHAMWRELLNYNPIGVSTTGGSNDYGHQAEDLFGKITLDDSSAQTGNDGESQGSGIDRFPENGRGSSPAWDEEEIDKSFEKAQNQQITSSVALNTVKVSSLQCSTSSTVSNTSRSSTPSTSHSIKYKATGAKSSTGKRGVHNGMSLEEIHAMELQESSEQCQQKLEIRKRELALEEKKHDAKAWKLELEMKKMEMEQRRMALEERHMEMMMSRFMGNSGNMGGGFDMLIGSQPSSSLESDAGPSLSFLPMPDNNLSNFQW